MQWEFIVAIVIAVPVMLFPVALIWYLNIGGMVAVLRRARARKHALHQEQAGIRVKN